MRHTFDIPKFVEWVVTTWAPVAAMSDRAAYSRSHFSRIMASGLGEPPGALRRRLRLEAGAYLLRQTSLSVGEVAVEVGYQTPEAFAKAFQKGFGLAPGRFRQRGDEPLWLESPSGVHFHPSGLIVRRQGNNNMTLTQILFRHHVDEVSTILSTMEALTDAQLDQETVFQGDEVPFDKHANTLRALLDRIVFTQEVWLLAFEGRGLSETEPGKSLPSLVERHEKSSRGLLAFVDDVEAKGLWDSEFVDALCEPPERFTFGGVLAHIIVFSAHRRQMALAALRELGVETVGYGDPINWLRGTNPVGAC